MELDWLNNVDWLYVVLISLFALVASAIGHLLSFNHRGMGAVLTAVIFGAGFVFWSYYPHKVPLLPTRLRVETPPVAAAPPPPLPTTPQPLRNPVTTISPPAAAPAPAPAAPAAPPPANQ